MTSWCDYCYKQLPDGYVPEVDARGRFVQAVCRVCKLAQVFAAETRRAEWRKGQNETPERIH